MDTAMDTASVRCPRMRRNILGHENALNEGVYCGVVISLGLLGTSWE